MSSEKTPKLGLHKWAPTDFVRMDEFNENFDKLDEVAGDVAETESKVAAVETAVAGKAEQSEVDSLTTQLADTTKYTTDPTPYLGNGKKEKRVIVSFIADDAPKNDLTKLLPIMQSKNIPVGIGVITDLVGKTDSGMGEMMTWDDIKLMERNGAEIMGHTHMHRNSAELTPVEFEADLIMNKKILAQRGYLADGLIYPYNATDNNVDKITRKHFKYSFAKNGAMSQKQGQNYPLFDNQRIGRISLGSFYDTPEEGFPQDTSSLEYYKARVDWAISNDNWLVFVLHTHSNNFPMDQQQYLRELIDYIRLKGVGIVSPREGFERYGNIMQIGSHVESGSYIIDSNRQIYNQSNRVFVDNLDRRASADLITDYLYQQITITPISNVKATSGGFPTGRGGILTTYNLSSADYNRYQTYEVLNGLKFQYTRYWVSGGWGQWDISPHGATHYGGGFTSDSPITDFPIGKITYSRFSNPMASSAGMPLNRGGLLSTYRLTSDYYVNKQEYIVSGSLTADLREVAYVRYLDSANNWLPWARKNVIEYAETRNVGDIPAHSTVDVTFVGVAGLTELDNPTIRASSLPPGLMISLISVDTNTVVFRVINVTAATISPGNIYYKVVVTKK